MEIKYTLEEEDLRALVEHQFRQSPIIPRRISRRRTLYVVAFSALSLGAFLLPDRPLSYGFAIIAILFLVLYKPIMRRQLVRSVPRIVRERMSQNSVGEKRLRALPHALEATSPHADTKARWSIVGPVETSETHLFIPLDGIYSIVVPISKVTSGDPARFAAYVAARIKAAA